jgi:glycosyltransferase involved in cell wall biosynthesis
MQVAHVLRKYNPAEWGGTETAVQRLCDGLRAHAVESIAFCPQLESDVMDDPLTRAGHRVKRFNACVPVWGISAASRRSLVAIGGNLLSFDLLWDLWREPKVDLVHVHTQNRLGGIGLTVSRLRRIPLVAQIHGGALDLPAAARQALDAPRRGGVEWGKVFGAPLRSRRVLECADAILACNGAEAKLLRQRYPQQRIVVQPHGVPAAEYERDRRAAAQEAFPQIAGRTVLLMAGRIDTVKNQTWAVEQFAEIFLRHPNALLVVAGSVTDPPYAAALQQSVQRLGLARGVLLTGPLPSGDPRLVGLFQLARSLILPSLSETFGLVILEAWASGAPVISSRTSGALELVVDGENGCLFDLKNPREFHAAVNGVLSYPDAAARMGQAGKGLVKSKFDTVALAGRVKSLYDELIQEKRGSRHAAR